MKRFHSQGDQKAIRKRLKDIKLSSPFPEKLSFPGRLRKKHPFDCGNPQCGICHRIEKPGRQQNIKKEFHED